MKTRTFGNERTALQLTDQAAEVYRNTWPLEIIEKDTEEGYRYDITGVITAEDITADEVNDTLEEWYEDETEDGDE